MSAFYQYTVSFAHSDTTIQPAPEVVMPANIVPAIPPVGGTAIFTQQDGTLYIGVVTQLAYNIQAETTYVVVTVEPAPPGPTAALKKKFGKRKSRS